MKDADRGNKSRKHMHQKKQTEVSKEHFRHILKPKHIKTEALQVETSPDRGHKQDFALKNGEMKALLGLSLGFWGGSGSFLD